MTKGALTGVLSSSYLAVGGGAGVGGWQITEAVKKAAAYERQLCIDAMSAYDKATSTGGKTLEEESKLRQPAITYCRVVSSDPQTNIWKFAPKGD